MRATYRLQLGDGLGFQEACSLVPYLRELGVSHLYLSPLLQARSGSTSGYDVVDPSRVSEELGGERGLRELAAAGLGVIVDIVPNHMAACGENRFWADERLRGRFFDIDPVTGRHRRFFDIDELAGVRQEDDEVFQATHEKMLQLVREGIVDGLRIDHIDGLADPAGYLHRLHQEGVAQVWVEKILQTNEALRDWPVEGTVGYEFLNDVTALFVDQWGEKGLTQLYAEFTGDRRSFSEVALGAQVEQATTTFRPEVERLRRIARPARDPRVARASAGVPDLRGTLLRRGERRRPHLDRAGADACAPGERHAAPDAADAGTRGAFPADLACDQGKGGGGHGLLPLQPPAGAQ